MNRTRWLTQMMPTSSIHSPEHRTHATRTKLGRVEKERTAGKSVGYGVGPFSEVIDHFGMDDHRWRVLLTMAFPLFLLPSLNSWFYLRGWPAERYQRFMDLQM